MKSDSAKSRDKQDLFMDPMRDKEKFKHQISEATINLFPELDEVEVIRVVSARYEELLSIARVKQHVPTLTEGSVRSEFRHRKHCDTSH